MAERADLVWKTLFVDNTPLSEATRGIVTLLKRFRTRFASRDLDQTRAFFRSRESFQSTVDLVLKISQVSEIVMTNDPFQ